MIPLASLQQKYIKIHCRESQSIKMQVYKKTINYVYFINNFTLKNAYLAKTHYIQGKGIKIQADKN